MTLKEWLADTTVPYADFARRIGVANAGVVSKYAAGRVPRSRRVRDAIVRETGEKVQLSDLYPAVVLPCTTDQDGVVGLQRIFLRDDGSGKRWGKQSKLSLGRPRGAAVRLSMSNPAEVTICEGPEDGLSLAQEMPDASVWVALGTAMMPEMVFPVAVRSVVIARQNDAAAIAATAKARAAMIERGIAVREVSPAAGFKDWNDQLRGVRL